MHFNIYLDDETGQQLNEVAQQKGEKRNTLVRRAVQEWLAHQAQPGWPQTVLAHVGDDKMPAFETGRRHLRPTVDDPLA
ncbi:MAG: CopG family transcriptional regulator [Burkholderiales bacterium]